MNFPSLFAFNGRVGRGPLWIILLVGVVISVIVNVGMTSVFGGATVDQNGTPSVNPMLLIVSGLVSIVVGLVNISFQVRRCHDRDRSGWFVLLWILPILNIWGFIEMYCLAGTVGMNRFGSDPTSRGLADTVETFR